MIVDWRGGFGLEKNPGGLTVFYTDRRQAATTSPSFGGRGGLDVVYSHSYGEEVTGTDILGFPGAGLGNSTRM